MSIFSKISFAFFFLTGGIFLTGSYLSLRGFDSPWGEIAKNVFDLPFFAFALIFFVSLLSDELAKYKKNSQFLHFLLAFFVILLILALVYVNIGIVDK